MHLAWLRPTRPEPGDPLDDTAQLIHALRDRHTIDVFDARLAYDMVRMHARHAYDLHVYELDDTPGHQFIWPSLLHYPGLTLLRSLTLQASRTGALLREGRAGDAARECAFDLGRLDAPIPRVRRPALHVWPMLRAPVVASRTCIVPHVATADTLRVRYPDARITALPVAVSAPAPRRPIHGGCTFGVIVTDDERDRLAVVHRALQRAREGGPPADGTPLDLYVDADARQVLALSDVVLALRWPAPGAPVVPAIAGMAAGRAVVVFDTAETADWPSLDPQTWRERQSFGSRPPICVSLDLRDEEHSLMMAMRRLAADVPLRERLAAAAETCWRAHHAPERVAPLFEGILQETVATMPPPRPPGWPAHLNADGTARAREILSELGVTVDIL
jgi:hypothetical protein